MEEAVVLIVKAPNQQIDDQTIHCELSWTVQMLKDHLSNVYPSKPPVVDQKLIYSGQLLNDSATLKEVLRMYEGQENHTVHLVCSPSKESWKATTMKSKKPTPQPNSPPQRPAPEEVDDSDDEDYASTPQPEAWDPQRPQVRHRGFPANGSVPQPAWPPMFGAVDASTMAQQMAWMQQAYAQYMTQYMQFMASGNMQMPMGMPMGMQMPMGVQMPMGMQMPPTGNNMQNMPPAAHPPPLRDDPNPVNEPVPNNEDEEARGHRDWLEWFYITTRMLVLFSIVYFYSSPVRFFVVSTLGIIFYLYQVGFFRAVQRLEQPEEPPVTPTPPPTPDNNNVAPPEAPPQPPSALAVTWAAFTSFFLSLIPEQPNIL